MSLLGLMFGLLLLMASWSAFKRSLLDHTRDELFDLRDGLREHFLAKGIVLDHPVYLELRRLLNIYIRFAQEVRFVGMVYFVGRARREQIERIKAEMDERFQTDDPELARYVEDIRVQAAAVIRTHMVMSSTLAWAGGFVVLVVTLMARVGMGARSLAKSAGELQCLVVGQNSLEVAASRDSPRPCAA